MAKFKQNNLELRDNQKLIFDTAKNKYISYDGSEVYVNTTISGVTPTEDYHLATKAYADSLEPVFGSEADYAESEGESSTTSDTYVQVLRLTTGTVASGTYRIGWGYEYTASSDKADGLQVIDLDSGTILHELNSPPQKKYADGGWYSYSGFKHTVLSNASHTIDLNHKADVAAQASTQYKRRVRIEIWRVS